VTFCWLHCSSQVSHCAQFCHLCICCKVLVLLVRLPCCCRAFLLACCCRCCRPIMLGPGTMVGPGASSSPFKARNVQMEGHIVNIDSRQDYMYQRWLNQSQKHQFVVAASYTFKCARTASCRLQDAYSTYLACRLSTDPPCRLLTDTVHRS
jgi:hypothetical protein